MSMKMMTMIMLRSGGGEEMMETGRPVGHLGRVVKDPKSGNKFDVSELQDEENLSPAKKKHYCRHTNSQIQANGSVSLVSFFFHFDFILSMCVTHISTLFFCFIIPIRKA